MSVMDDIADEFAVKALEIELRTGDETVIKKIGDALAQSSPTMEETFLTAVRIRRAEHRARAIFAAFDASSSQPQAAPLDKDLPAVPDGPEVSFDAD